MFPLRKTTHYSAADFVVTPSNHIAHGYITAWPMWTAMGGVIVAPLGAGKTHLCHVWQEKTQALWVTLDTIEALDFSILKGSAIIVDDIDQFFPQHEEVLFHLFNHIKSERGSLLITSSIRPKLWKIKLKDLESRLSSLPVFEIQNPDDILFLAILTKNFSDYQLQVSSAVLEFILKQAPRTFESLQKIPQQLNDRSLRERSNITIPFVKETLDF